MKPAWLGMAVAAAVVAATPTHAELRALVLEGQMQGARGTRSVTLHLECEPDPRGGAISLALWVPQAHPLKDFDYDDFEGPDAAARDRALSHLSLGGGKPTSHAAAGWYAGEAPDTFVFAVSQRSHQKGPVATLLEGLDDAPAQLVWVQNGFDDPKRELRASFALDAALTGRLRDTADACLTPSGPAKRPDKKQ